MPWIYVHVGLCVSPLAVLGLCLSANTYLRLLPRTGACVFVCVRVRVCVRNGEAILFFGTMPALVQNMLSSSLQGPGTMLILLFSSHRSPSSCFSSHLQCYQPHRNTHKDVFHPLYYDASALSPCANPSNRNLYHYFPHHIAPFAIYKGTHTHIYVYIQICFHSDACDIRSPRWY